MLLWIELKKSGKKIEELLVLPTAVEKGELFEKSEFIQWYKAYRTKYGEHTIVLSEKELDLPELPAWINLQRDDCNLRTAVKLQRAQVNVLLISADQIFGLCAKEGDDIQVFNFEDNNKKPPTHKKNSDFLKAFPVIQMSKRERSSPESSATHATKKKEKLTEEDKLTEKENFVEAHNST